MEKNNIKYDYEYDWTTPEALKNSSVIQNLIVKNKINININESNKNDKIKITQKGSGNFYFLNIFR